ncbi:MAG: hypothetical protein ISR64_09710 [Deltaproteobacteria bacterium]|nr:hypothetical protein [Deltaproteobacteria bacterium]
MSVEKRVLIPGAGGPGAVNMTRSLLLAPEPVFMVGCDCSEYYIHLALTSEKYLIPPASREDEYIDAISRLVDRHDLNFIYPNSSLEMMVLTRHAADLPAPLFVPSLETQETAASKWLTWQCWDRAGIPVPRTVLIDGPDDIEKAFDTLSSRPIWFRGAGIPGKGVGMAALPCRRPIEARGWIEFHDGFGQFVASEFLPGDNLTFMGLYRQGRLVTSQGRKRIKYVIPHVSPSGITGAPAVCHTVHRDDINDLGHRAILAVDPEFNGVAFIDFKGADDGRILPTEINAGRFGTTHHFYTAAGRNNPYFLLKMAFDEALPADLPRYNALPADLYWIRTLDAGPVLLSREELAVGEG